MVRHGLLTRHQLRSSAWVRVRHDVYADARLDRDHSLACRAAALQLPSDALIAGPSSAYLHGIEHAADFTDDVHVLARRPARLRSQHRLRIHSTLLTVPPPGPHQPGQLLTAPPPSPHEPGQLLTAPPPRPHQPGQLLTAPPSGPLLPPGQGPREPSRSLWTADGPLTFATDRPLRTGPADAAWETAVWLDPIRAVGIVDALLGRGLTTPAALAEIGDRNAERPGGRRARWVFGLADPRAESPAESALRVRLVLAGLPRPLVQHPVRLLSGLVLHPDLAWPEFRVAVEYDGHWHAEPDQLHRDRRRLNQLVTAGWLVLHVTSHRLHREFPAVVREVRTALTSRGWRP
ncbi:endonuclease domain-containing protein [Micromonospora sp. NPDC093277]|uniref:endonuclease domain-containing protein n=1 Tax=Micromonospora sp. NPDC093277 TaxID=3364291 RepID=UPI0037F28B7E